MKMFKKITQKVSNYFSDNPTKEQQQLDFQRFKQPFDRDHYVIDKENYEWFKNSNRQAIIEQVKGPINVNGEYYVVDTSNINKEVYDEYLSKNDQQKSLAPEQLTSQLQQFMQRLMHPHDNTSYVVGEENFKCLLEKNPSQQAIEGPIKFSGEYYIIGRGIYDQSLSLEQQNHHLSLQFMRQLVQQINNDYYVIGKEIYENYKHFLGKIPDHQTQQVTEQAARPININEEYFVISKETFDNYYARIASNFHNGVNNQEKSERDDLRSQIQTLEKNNQSLNNRNNDLQSQIQTLENNNQHLNNRNSELLKVYNDLREEASRYQSALGDATSFHLGNQDFNSTSQLLKDIRNLHYKLEKFCGTKKGVKVNEQKARELLEKYNCSTIGKLNDNLVSGVLERNVIETIVEKTEEYFNNEENDNDGKDEEKGDGKQQQNLEAKIMDTTEKLLVMTKIFSTIRTGTDEVSKAIPTKLRQQIYSVLGHRGFSKTVIGEKDSKEHPLILKLRKDVLDLMDSYREITDGKKSVENEKNIIEIIRQVINIFFFRLKVQEPIAEWKWFKNNDEINTLTMGGYYNENEIENLCVDVCMFPLIGSNISSSDGDEKVMFQAQILTKKKNN